MKLTKFFEFKRGAFVPLKSFRLQDELPSKIWTDFEIDDDVRKQLLQIAQDFYDGTEIKADVVDIVLCGSLCNYNWSERYSDYDLHITIDFKDVDENYDLVEKLCDYAKKIWNDQHDIKIKGYEVEVYIQDVSEPHKSTGVFSLLNNKWNIKPEKFNFEPDEDMIAEKGKSVMMAVDELEEEVDEDKYEAFHEKLQKVWEKVKNYRKSGLESEGGELSMGNLVFKFLRRNGYISKIIELKRKSYDKQFK